MSNQERLERLAARSGLGGQARCKHIGKGRGYILFAVAADGDFVQIGHYPALHIAESQIPADVRRFLEVEQS